MRVKLALASSAAGDGSSTGSSRTAAVPAGDCSSSQQQVACSSDVVEEQDVPGVGRFVATADGRVRALFADRTILHMPPGSATARLVLPDGSAAEVGADNPVGVEQYVQVGALGTFVHVSNAQCRVCVPACSRALRALPGAGALHTGTTRAAACLQVPRHSQVTASLPHTCLLHSSVCRTTLQAALEFAAWSTTSPADRAAALRMQVREGAAPGRAPGGCPLLAECLTKQHRAGCSPSRAATAVAFTAVQALVAAELRSSARMAAICEWGSRRALPAHVSAATAAAAAAEAGAEHELPWPASVDWAGELDLPEPAAPQPAAPATVCCSGGAYARHEAVRDLLAANEALLARLAV